jgi:hypothetical protein
VRERYFADHEVDGSTRQEVEALLAFDSGASTYLVRDVSLAASRALRVLRETKGLPARAIKPDSEAGIALRALADHYAETSNSSEAIEAYQDLRGKMMASNPDPRNDLVNAAQLSRLDASLSAVLRRVGRANAAALEQTARSCGGSGHQAARQRVCPRSDRNVS